MEKSGGLRSEIDEGRLGDALARSFSLFFFFLQLVWTLMDSGESWQLFCCVAKPVSVEQPSDCGTDRERERPLHYSYQGEKTVALVPELNEES